MQTVIIIQARMSSTRLPGKILKRVLDKTLMEYQLERLQRVKLVDNIVVATTVNHSDDPVVELCKSLGVSCFRGSEEDVLSRYYHAASEYKADVVVRITSDCPLIDPAIVDRVISHYFSNMDSYDYVSNVLQRTYPRGMDTEVFPFSILQEAHFKAVQIPEREHVTPYIRQIACKRLANVVYHEDQSRHRWTVDQEEDFQLIEKILQELYLSKPCFSMETVLNLLEKHPDWVMINSGVKQKKLNRI